MLVVVAIIAILISVVYPAITSGRNRAKKTNELNLIRETGKAWIMHNGMHQDKMLKGYLGTGVQQYWEQAWAFEDESLVSPAPEYFSSAPNDAGPWPWRLLSYMDYDWRSLLFTMTLNGTIVMNISRNMLVKLQCNLLLATTVSTLGDGGRLTITAVNPRQFLVVQHLLTEDNSMSSLRSIHKSERQINKLFFAVRFMLNKDRTKKGRTTLRAHILQFPAC